MFPVPTHLPRAGGDHLSQETLKPEVTGDQDPILGFLSPILQDKTTWSASEVKGVRERLEGEIHRNKTAGHELLLANFPSITSHIRNGDQVQNDFQRVKRAIESLEKEIDPSLPSSSFLPPLLKSLDRHHRSQTSLARSRAQILALKSLKDQSEKVIKLEQAVWAGRGADDWVLKELLNGSVTSEDILDGTRVVKDIQAKRKLYRSMITEQVTDAYSKAVSFGEDGKSLNILTRTTLQQPRIPHALQAGETTRPSIPPPYSLSQIYTVLSNLSALTSTLQSLRNRIIKQLLDPLVHGTSTYDSTHYKLVHTDVDSKHSLRLEHAELRHPNQILNDITQMIDFVSTTVIPPTEPSLPERETFLVDLRAAVLQAILDNVIVPSIPPTLSLVPKWLETLEQAVKFESTSLEANGHGAIHTFFETSAGPAWVSLRRQRIEDEMRRLILGGWGGWEAIESEREKEITVLEEQEETIPSVSEEGKVDEVMTSDEADFGWGFGDEPSSQNGSAERQVEDDGWGFENAQAGPSRSSPSSTIERDELHLETEKTEEEGGWGFESPVAETAPVIAPINTRPAREAKRLGKKVAKVKHAEEEDPWAMPENDPPPEPDKASIPANLNLLDSTSTNSSSDRRTVNGVDVRPVDADVISSKEQKNVRMVMKEIKRTVKEVYHISRACEKVCEIAERLLREIEDLKDMSLSSPSFANAHISLQSSLSDIFDIYRLLLPTHFNNQIAHVPAIAFQVYNDHSHLASCIKDLRTQYVWWDVEDVLERMEVGGVRIFEEQLGIQVDAFAVTLNGCRGFVDVGDEVGYQDCERTMKDVIHDLETLAKVIKTVLPLSTYLSVIGYLLDTIIQSITTDILTFTDITESESTRLNDLIQLVHPLDSLFVLEPGQSTIVAHVPHWLKFCYISELLTANLVDITYLFETGALVDFTTAELIGLVRALFADSPKRDTAIEKIETGLDGK